MPDNTQMEDRSIIVNGDVLIGNHSEISYGLLARSIIIGERVKIDGDVVAEGDIRLDLWSDINGDVRTKKDAYIGERTNINGKLVVKGDLDIGNDDIGPLGLDHVEPLLTIHGHQDLISPIF